MVSVILPVYNSQEYLEQAVNSMLNQSLEEWEIIAINDASTDGSLNVLNDYASKDSRVRIINFRENKGQGYARNLAISKATGAYILFLDADDLLVEDALVILRKNIVKKPKTDVFVWGYKIKTLTEEFVLKLLYKQKKKLSILFITHRVHVLKKFADVIYILEDQRIVDFGSHEQLLKAGNSYSDFWINLGLTTKKR